MLLSMKHNAAKDMVKKYPDVDFQRLLLEAESAGTELFEAQSIAPTAIPEKMSADWHLAQQTALLTTIKNCLMFFVMLTIIGLGGTMIMLGQLMSAFRF